MTRVDPILDAPRPREQFLNEQDKANYDLCKICPKFQGLCRSNDMHLDTPEIFKNAPVGLQLVGRCQEEEAVIAMTEIVDTALKEFKMRGPKL